MRRAPVPVGDSFGGSEEWGQQQWPAGGSLRLRFPMLCWNVLLLVRSLLFPLSLIRFASRHYSDSYICNCPSCCTPPRMLPRGQSYGRSFTTGQVRPVARVPRGRDVVDTTLGIPCPGLASPTALPRSTTSSTTSLRPSASRCSARWSRRPWRRWTCPAASACGATATCGPSRQAAPRTTTVSHSSPCRPLLGRPSPAAS